MGAGHGHYEFSARHVVEYWSQRTGSECFSDHFNGTACRRTGQDQAGDVFEGHRTDFAGKMPGLPPARADRAHVIADLPRSTSLTERQHDARVAALADSLVPRYGGRK